MTRQTSDGWFDRGYLPHYQGEEHPQLLTIRLANSFPNEKLLQWERELSALDQKKAGSIIRKRIEKYLDASYGEPLLNHPIIGAEVAGTFKRFDGERYALHAWVLMPNHAHVLITPKRDQELSKILHSWKSYTSSFANKMLERSGAFWQREYFDRFIRDGRHFATARKYVEDNPVKARLCRSADEWVFSSAYRG